MKTDDDQIELLIEKFKWLRLPGMAARLREILELAAKKNLGGLEVAHRLADEEKSSRIRSARRPATAAPARPSSGGTGPRATRSPCVASRSRRAMESSASAASSRGPTTGSGA